MNTYIAITILIITWFFVGLLIALLRIFQLQKHKPEGAISHSNLVSLLPILISGILFWPILLVTVYIDYKNPRKLIKYAMAQMWLPYRILVRLFARKLSTFSFEFDPNLEENFRVSIVEDSYFSLEKYDEEEKRFHMIWVWSLYYAKILYTLGQNQISFGLKENMEKWAESIVPGLGFPLQIAKEMGLLILDREMQLTVKESLSNPNAKVYVLNVFKPGDDWWPHIQTHFHPKAI